MDRLIRNLAFGIALWGTLAPPAASADAPPRTLRVGMPIVTDTLDPARFESMQAAMLMAGIFDTLYALDPLARPAAIVPLAAAALPEVSADFRTFTVRVRPGTFFTPHRAFGGKPRELTAADFAYAFKRVVDPKIRSQGLYLVEGKIEGLDALAQRGREDGRAFDYDTPVAGLVVVDRMTLRIHLNAPDPIFPFLLTSSLMGGVAREVVESEGEGFGQHPVGTGAFVATEFAPGRRLVLTRNPDFRPLRGDDLLSPASRAANASHPLRGMRLPGADRIEFSSTPESSAELLALRRGELDLIYLNAPELATRDGKLKAELARDGLRLVRDTMPVSLLSFFSMRDPVVGGDALEKIALRRAIQMAFDDDEWIRVLDAGFSAIRHQVVPPGVDGHLPEYRNPNLFNPDAANALLDRFGYRRGADRFRRNPDGSALTVPVMIGTSSDARKGAEFTKRMLDRIGLHTAFEAIPGSDRMKRMAHCRFGMATMDWALDIPDGTNPLSMFWSKGIGSVNMSCYADPVFDAAYEKALVTPPGPARTELFRTMQMRLDAYAPMRPRPVSDTLLLKRARVVGPFATLNDWLQVMTLGVDPAAAPAR
ncbi:MAG: ABC transporter substrate-binding protein [Betaproteobacteria bacterium]